MMASEDSKLLDPKRPISWSCLSAWEWDKEKWYRRYVLSEKEDPTGSMIFGKEIGERLADPSFMPEVPRYKIAEQKLEAKLGKINLLGYMDFYDGKKKMIEIKTGKKWTFAKADTHGQLDFYAMLLYLEKKIKPEQLDIKLVWLATEQVKGKTVFIKDMKPEIYQVKKTMLDVLQMMSRIKQAHAEMIKYIPANDRVEMVVGGKVLVLNKR